MGKKIDFTAQAFVGSKNVGTVDATMDVEGTGKVRWANGTLRFVDSPAADVLGRKVRLVFDDQEVIVVALRANSCMEFDAKAGTDLPATWA